MAPIQIGDPLLVLTPRDGAGWRKFRCAVCGGGAPADLPPLPDHLPAVRPLTPLRELSPDWKAKASGS
jgi:hypothetical protein